MVRTGSYTWTHSRGDGFADPINLEFYADLSDITKVFDNIPWHVPGVPWVHDQYLIDGRKQRLQMASEGDLSSVWHPRHHIRLWENVDGRIIGSAHYEIFSFPGHDVVSFDDAVEHVAEVFRRLTGWQTDDGPDVRNSTDRPANRGNLTTITKV